MNDLKTVPCKGCGKPIVWAEFHKEDGSRGKVPLDPRAPVYYVRGTLADGAQFVARADGIERTAGKPTGNRGPTAYVSHFATCPNANEFSGRGRTSRPSSGSTPGGKAEGGP